MTQDTDTQSNRVKVSISSRVGHLPTYAKEGDAGADLRSTEAVAIVPGGSRLIRCGISIGLPTGYVGLVCSRSGLAYNNGVFVLNSPGVIDSGYRGEIGVILHNAGKKVFDVNIGDRVAQLMLVPYATADWVEVADVSAENTERGAGGFGSSGVS